MRARISGKPEGKRRALGLSLRSVLLSECELPCDVRRDDRKREKGKGEYERSKENDIDHMRLICRKAAIEQSGWKALRSIRRWRWPVPSDALHGEDETEDSPAGKRPYQWLNGERGRHPQMPRLGYGGAESAGCDQAEKKEGRGGWPLPTR